MAKPTQAQKDILGYAIRPSNHGFLPSGYRFNKASLKVCVNNGWLVQSRWGIYYITDLGRKVISTSAKEGEVNL